MKKILGILSLFLFAGCMGSGGGEYVSEQKIYYNNVVAYFETIPVEENSIIMLGDSITERGDWDTLFPDKNMVNFGISGDNSGGVLKRINQVIKWKPLKVFIMVGTNDFYAERPADLIPNYEEIVSAIQKDSPDTEIYLQSILPARNSMRDNSAIINLNTKIEGVAEKYGVKYIELYSEFIDANGDLQSGYTVDNLHLNDAGYAKWIEIIEGYM